MAKENANGYKKGNFIVVLILASITVAGVFAGVVIWGQECKGEINRAHTRIDHTEERMDRMEKHLGEKYDDMRTEQRALSNKMDRIIELQLQKD